MRGQTQLTNLEKLGNRVHAVLRDDSHHVVISDSTVDDSYETKPLYVSTFSGTKIRWTIPTSNTNSLQRYRKHTSAHNAVVTGVQRPRAHASRNDTQHHCNDRQDGESKGHSQDGLLIGLYDGERRRLCRRWKGFHGRQFVSVSRQNGISTRLRNEAL